MTSGAEFNPNGELENGLAVMEPPRAPCTFAKEALTFRRTGDSRARGVAGNRLSDIVRSYPWGAWRPRQIQPLTTGYQAHGGRRSLFVPNILDVV